MDNMLLRTAVRSGVLKASALLAFFTLAGKLVGLWRDRILASQFGASRTLDIYYSAFKIPDLIFNLLILGAVSAAVIPVFLEYREKDEREGWRAVENFTNIGFVAVLAACTFIFIFAGPFTDLIAPGFAGRDKELLTQLLRFMLLSPIVFSVSAVLGSVLQALERFFAYAVAPIVYNVGIIIGAVYLVPVAVARGYADVMGLGAGVVLGAILHLVVQLVPVLRAGFRFRKVFDIAGTGFVKMVRLMAPRSLALGTYSVGLAVINAFASALGVGAITVLNLATNLQFLPISIIGISIATAAFPRLSKHAAARDSSAFVEELKSAMKNTAWTVGLAALAMFLLRSQIVGVLYGLGAFGTADVELTALLLGIFMFSVPAQSLIHIVTRAFYALQNTRTPFWIAVWSIALNIALSYMFAFPFGWGIVGLVVAYVVAYNLNFLLLYILFRKKHPSHVHT